MLIELFFKFAYLVGHDLKESFNVSKNAANSHWLLLVIIY